MTLKKKLAFAVFILIISAFLITFSLKLMRREKPPDFIETTGVVEATEVNLASKVSGRIEKLCCAEGDGIKAGTVAVVLDSAEIRARVEEGKAGIIQAAQALNEARVNIENAKVQSESAKFDFDAAASEVARISVLLDDAKVNLDRAKGLYKDGYITKKDMDSAQTAFDANNALFSSAKARRQAAESNYKNSVVNIRASAARIATAQARKALAEAQLKVLLAGLEDTEIRSPMDGVIVYKAYELGEFATPGATVYTIDDLKNIWARVDIEETYIQRLKLGDKAEVRAIGMPGKVFSGKLIEIGEVGGFATQRDVTRGRSDIKTFRVKAGIDRPEGLLKPGMTVSVRIYFREKAG